MSGSVANGKNRCQQIRGLKVKPILLPISYGYCTVAEDSYLFSFKAWRSDSIDCGYDEVLWQIIHAISMNMVPGCHCSITLCVQYFPLPAIYKIQFTKYFLVDHPDSIFHTDSLKLLEFQEE